MEWKERGEEQPIPDSEAGLVDWTLAGCAGPGEGTLYRREVRQSGVGHGDPVSRAV